MMYPCGESPTLLRKATLKWNVLETRDAGEIAAANRGAQIRVDVSQHAANLPRREALSHTLRNR